MIIVTLPYSKQVFDINIIRFANMFDIARIILEEDDRGLLNYFEDFFKMRHLNVVDKFYVLLKAREMFIDDCISINIGEGNVNIQIRSILNNLKDLPDCRKTFTKDGVKLILDAPHSFTLSNVSNIFEAFIDTIICLGDKVKYRELNSHDQMAVLKALPSNIFNNIRDYYDMCKLSVVLFEGNSSLDIAPQEINFLGTDPFAFIKSLYGDYDVYSCRDILFHLSKRMSGEIVLQSTPNDIKFYLDELSKESKSSSGNNAMDL